MVNTQEILKKMHDGQLTQEDFDQIVEAVRDGPHDDDLYLLITILGKTGFPELHPLVEKLLYYPKNPFVSRQALITLCDEWGLTQHYLDQIKSFIKGVEWDVNEDLRIIAINIGGYYLRDQLDRELLSLLVEIFENFGHSPVVKEFYTNSRSLMRRFAYESILESMGIDYADIPTNVDELIEMGRMEELDLATVNKAKEKLNNSTLSGE